MPALPSSRSDDAHVNPRLVIAARSKSIEIGNTPLTLSTNMPFCFIDFSTFVQYRPGRLAPSWHFGSHLTRRTGYSYSQIIFFPLQTVIHVSIRRKQGQDVGWLQVVFG